MIHRIRGRILHILGNQIDRYDLFPNIYSIYSPIFFSSVSSIHFFFFSGCVIQFENLGLHMQLVDVINLFHTYLLASFAYPIVVRNHGSVRNKLFHLFWWNKIVTTCSFGTNLNFSKWNIVYTEQTNRLVPTE